jgi:hypothetical protein
MGNFISNTTNSTLNDDIYITYLDKMEKGYATTVYNTNICKNCKTNIHSNNVQRCKINIHSNNVQRCNKNTYFY